MSFFDAMNVSASGLAAQRTRLNVASSNLANVHTTRAADGGPYSPKQVVLQAAPGDHGDGDGVRVAEIREDDGPPRFEFDPGHPDADINGFVAYPDINVVEQMVDMITASRAYEAGLTVVGTAVSLAERALTIGK